MSTRIRNLLLAIVLLAAAGGTWLLRPPIIEDTPVTRTSSADRGFYILDAIFSGLDEHGELLYRLAAARIEGSEQTEQLRFHDVEIRYTQAQNVPWQITAAQASRRADTQTLELMQVVIESTDEAAARSVRIEADSLELETDNQLAHTSGAVRFAIGANRIDAVGLMADLHNEKITMESGVSGRVSP